MANHVLFYHYTSKEGLQGIKASRQINNSAPDDNHTHFGPGTYGTSMPPWRGQDAIAANNWRGHGEYYIRNGKVSWVVEVKIPRNKVQETGGNRDILLHNGPVRLNDYEWRMLEVPRHPTISESFGKVHAAGGGGSFLTTLAKLCVGAFALYRLFR